jgi:hypothetical protein
MVPVAKLCVVVWEDFESRVDVGREWFDQSEAALEIPLLQLQHSKLEHFLKYLLSIFECTWTIIQARDLSN